ncbi:hypothetical protein BegalDRAFT_0238 [Beggiatoa alba B18LD]|uniref:DUF4276 domain-containing protein n=1 Tax=Beggiatoa alba B18LD TaxID=395493 RepID=I3CC17_9GAMM|nr:DUF4276 family protein [Beggiatoa alba]EIJ41160.1 hypothetical protein BegalDRAFT_0238 [Beggiatoa alba B18LD]
MKLLVFFLEEPSAREMLQLLLPRLLPTKDFHYQFIVFEGKQDLEKNIARKIKNWHCPVDYFIILRDQDSGDCYTIKQHLVLKTADKPNVLIRIACHELESWYLGDLSAVEKGLNIKNLSKKQDNRKYRNPDKLANAAEELTKLTDGLYQKVSGSRAIGAYLSIEPNTNQSTSFNIFLSGLQKIITILDNSNFQN